MVVRLRKLHTEGPSGTASFERTVRLLRGMRPEETTRAPTGSER